MACRSPAAAGTANAADLIRLGEGPFITGGGFFVARAKGYFAKMGIELQTKSYTDGAMAVPSLLSGEIDITGTTANAALFNSVAKGAQLVLVLDHGNNKVGRAYTAMNVSTRMFNSGVKSIADFAKLKGKKHRPRAPPAASTNIRSQRRCRRPASIRARTSPGSPMCRSPT